VKSLTVFSSGLHDLTFKMAVPSYDQIYNYQYSTNIEQETDNIIELVKGVDILKPTKEELNKALSSIKKGGNDDLLEGGVMIFF
jgi:hypothetical protein